MKQQETNSDFLAVHEDVVKRVLDKQPAEEELYDLAELFKVFGDSTRIRIWNCSTGNRIVRGRYGADIESVSIRSQPPAQNFKRRETCTIPKRRKDYLLCIG